ncbi:MAG: elongation factor Ts [Chromatiales bacterium]|jgi:elongation factor Ts|nr:elongation factor Ts [Chromatiales bacterium]MDP6150677.1 translation elongation factor Ts [Gammaproteobacteria bacterium]MDP7270797.1 translation elongation factor Ts [Gammaproteobacteria bacterium]HJP03721.1 translation elongation factor Ts [Gammaproteobacteria bacterium]
MTITASLVKELRERTGAGMMECKKALVETDGDLEAAAELLRKKGQAKAEKKAGRIAAEGRVEIAANGSEVVVMEVNSETDFVAKDENFAAFARSAASLALSESPADVTTLMQASVAGGGTLEETRTTLIAKIGENISVRRFETISAIGSIGQYRHGERIGVVVDISGGDDELRKDIAMHIAASAPACIAEDNVPAEQLERERRILTEQAEQEGKPAEIVGKMVEGRLRKYLGEITLVGQSFVKDPDITVGKLLKQKGASVNAFARLEVGEGIEKKQEDFAAEVEAQVRASQNEDEKE